MEQVSAVQKANKIKKKEKIYFVSIRDACYMYADRLKVVSFLFAMSISHQHTHINRSTSFKNKKLKINSLCGCCQRWDNTWL